MFDEKKIDFKGSNSIYHIEFTLYHSVNIIYDESGKDKSHFVDALFSVLSSGSKSNKNFINAKYRGINVRYRIVEINSSTIDTTDYTLNDGYILAVFDDEKGILYSDVLCSILKSNERVIFLIISRGLSDIHSKLDCFTEAVYRVDCVLKDDIECLSLISYMNSFSNYIGSGCNGICCVIEGSSGKGEYNFYTMLNNDKDVICCGGKNNVLYKLEQVANDVNSILLAVDLCAFGTRIVDVISVAKCLGIELYLVDAYSFEYLMLCSLFPDSINGISNDVYSDYTKGMTFEKYINSVLSKMYLKETLKGRFKEKDIPKCLYDDCSCICNQFEIGRCRLPLDLKCDVNSKVDYFIKKMCSYKEVNDILLILKGV